MPQITLVDLARAQAPAPCAVVQVIALVAPAVTEQALSGITQHQKSPALQFIQAVQIRTDIPSSPDPWWS